MPNEAGSRRASCWVDHIANSNSSLACNEKPVSSADVRKAPESASKWNLEVSQLVSSESWLEMHGLKRAKLDLYSLLRQMGFRHANDFDPKLKMPVCSRYGTDLFQKYFRSDGKTYNVIMSIDMMKQIEYRLTQAVKLYQSRLDWLTTDSRRLFGVVEEKCVCIVLDFSPNLNQQLFDLYFGALELVIREQISRVSRFSIIRAQEDLMSLSSDLIYVTPENIQTAIQWIHSLKRTAHVDKLSACFAVDKASKLASVDAVYFFTEGSAADCCRETLSDQIKNSKVPVHIVSHNCTSLETVTSLQKMAQRAGTRFHAYAVTTALHLYERTDAAADDASSESGLVQRKKVFGGVPSGVGVREDVMKVFEELEEAKNILSQIQSIIKEREKTSPVAPGDTGGAVGAGAQSAAPESQQYDNETYMSSTQWLERHGLKAFKLGFYDVLSSVAFRHEDGVLDLKVAPPCDDDHIVDAVTVRKLVNAKYCNRFAHVIWNDGRVMHVNVTNELYRTYKERLQVVVNAMQRRIDWLLRGSREIFGTVVEDQIYLLIDTSYSMQVHMQFVKEKIHLLMQEQLRHKQMFNIIAFDTLVRSWQSSLIEVSEDSLRNAWSWVKELVCHGTTNTLDALQMALKDKQTKAIYLLTDGRPNHPPKAIIAQCKYRYKVPIHTISFNCNDREANEFLFDLAHATGGRFHYYSMSGHDLDPAGPVAWQSEDTLLLKQEVEKARKFLDRIGELHNDCVLLSRSKDETEPSVARKQIAGDKVNRLPATAVKTKPSYDRARPKYQRPVSAPSHRCFPHPPADSSLRPQTAIGYQNWARASVTGLPSPGEASGGNSARLDASSNQLFAANHTRTSFMRTTSVNSARFVEPEFLLPETKQLFEQQEMIKNKMKRAEEKKKKKHRMKNKQLVNDKKLSSKKWLAKHGLAAKKLTIIDLLAPTFISHEPRFVPALNKEVLSKVFDEVLPIGYARLMKKQLFLTNPLAVDFREYLKKLEDAKKLYERRLDNLVWNALPPNERQAFDSDVAVSFADNRDKLMEALGRCGEPVRLSDIQLLENEMRLADQYAEQADRLRRAAEKHGEGLPEYVENVDSVKEEVKEPKKNEQKPEQKKEVKVSYAPVKQRGLRVVARNDDDGFYYPGAVSDNVDQRHVKVGFDSPDLGVRDVASRLVIPLTGAIARPTLYICDRVLCRVQLKNMEQECYVPGKVVGLPKRRENKFFSVLLYTGLREQFMRSYLIKITEVRYDFTVRYIIQKAGISMPDDPPEPAPSNDVNNRGTQTTAESRDRDRDRDPRVSKLKEKLKRYRQNLVELHKELDVQYTNYVKAKAKRDVTGSHLKHLEDINNEIRKLKGQVAEARSQYADGDRRRQRRQWDDADEGVTSRGQKLRPLKINEEVLARWSDDGWYYRGEIILQMDDGHFMVRDSTKYIEVMRRQNIIADADDDGTFDRSDVRSFYVIAQHPDFEYSYCPGKAARSPSYRDSVHVKFYDGSEAVVSREEVYPISRDKYRADVEYIRRKEEDLVGQVVVANKNDTGIFYIGEVVAPTGVPREYEIKWADGTTSKQQSTRMFGSFTLQRKLNVGDRVLAPKDDGDTFLPATVVEVTRAKALVVEYCDGTSGDRVEQVACFWLSNSTFYSLVRAIRDSGAIRVVSDETAADDIEEQPSTRGAENEHLPRRRSANRSRSRSASSTGSSSSSSSSRSDGEIPGNESAKDQSDDEVRSRENSARAFSADRRPSGSRIVDDDEEEEKEQDEEEDVDDKEDASEDSDNSDRGRSSSR